MLIVLAIIALVVYNISIHFGQYVDDAIKTKAMHDIEVIILACHRFSQIEGKPVIELSQLSGRYLQDMVEDPWGNPYVLSLDYVISSGADATGGTPDDVQRSMKAYESNREEAADVAGNLAGFARSYETETGKRLEDLESLRDFLNKKRRRDGVIPIDPFGNKYTIDPILGDIVSDGDDGETDTEDDIRIPFREPGRIIVSDQSNNRVQVFDVNGGFILAFGTAGSGDGQFDRPCSVDVDKSGNIYVGDQVRVQKFDKTGRFLMKLPGTGAANGVAVTDGGTIIVTSPGNAVRAFDPSGNALWTQTGFSSPIGVVADRAGNIYVSNMGTHRIMVLNSAGSHISQFGSQGSTPGAFDRPGELEFGRDGDLLVADEVNKRIQVVTTAGAFVRMLAPGDFDLPLGVDQDARKRTIVCDHTKHEVRIFEAAGAQVRRFGGLGSEPGKFNLPSDVAVIDAN